MLLHGASDLDQRCLKTRISAVVALIGGSHQISLPVTPKCPPKPHFGGPFNAKPIIDRVLRKWHVNGATKLKLHSCIGILKYSNVCQNFFVRGRPGGAGPRNVHLGPPSSSKTATTRKLKLKIPWDVVKYSLWVQKKFREGASSGCRAPGCKFWTLRLSWKQLEIES